MNKNTDSGRPKSNSSESSKPFDPLEAWRNLRDVSLDAWAKAMTEAVNTQA